MLNTLSKLFKQMNDPGLTSANIIPWGCPVPSFGDLIRSKVATVGLNPSNKEFVDNKGKELEGQNRRFQTLRSLGIDKWSDADDDHLNLIYDSCRNYFKRNPYDYWFKNLDNLISGTQSSYYNMTSMLACHIDLVPYATSCKWTELTTQQRSYLMGLASETIGISLLESSVQLLILNGKSVVDNLQIVTRTSFDQIEMLDWTLPRKSGLGVKGYAYFGTINEISGIKFGRDITVLGFNHNIQSSFGVTKKIKNSIKDWITSVSEEVSS